MAERKVSRSTGMYVPGWFGPNPGGGYKGSTLELDGAVRSQAEWLIKQFDVDVEIRFNSNRQSGGAWVVDNKLKNTGIGLNVGRTYNRDTCTHSEPLHYHVYIAQPLLKSAYHHEVDRGISIPYVYYHADSLEHARAILLEKIDRVRM